MNYNQLQERLVQAGLSITVPERETTEVKLIVDGAEYEVDHTEVCVYHDPGEKNIVMFLVAKTEGK